jgi:uncharacterized protein YfaS (alpha-2-macroglobulin family)/tetratricopeptide (TPR) repeat protein
MKANHILVSFFGLVTCLALVTGAQLATPAEKADTPDPSIIERKYQEGNFKEAYEGFRQLALDANSARDRVGHYLNMAVASLTSLGRVDEIDEFRESVIQIHNQNWRLLQAAAESYLNVDHSGFIIAGKFYRGPHRGGGKIVNSFERDRVLALQLMGGAMPLANNDANKADVAHFYLAFARYLLSNRGYTEAWRLQYLTDLKALPDYEEGGGWYHYGEPKGAPVDENGDPVYHHAPKSWDAAATDGERWRWCLVQAMENDASNADQVRFEFAQFLESQFGVQTMAYYGWFFGRMNDDDSDKNESGTFALHTLGEDETIARLATGIKRFKLPEEFNHIRIYQQILADAKSPQSTWRAANQLADIFTNRRQYPNAADYLRQAIKAQPDNENSKQKLDQIVRNWGRFEPVMTQPAGKGATVEFRFRNAKQVSFEAHAIKVEKLLADVKAYLKSNPGQLDWQKINIGDLGHRLVQQNEGQYLGDKVASWNLPLEPRENHFDQRITVTTPLQKAGAYLVTARMQDGNTSKIILWLEDTAIVKKPLSDGTFYFVADAVTGAPVAGANLEFFGFKQRQIGNTNRFEVLTTNFEEATDKDGQYIRPTKAGEEQHQWIITARTKEGRLAYLGYTGVWGGNYYDAQYEQTKVFSITDRPVYRPGQKVKYKFWVRHAKYDQEDISTFANQNFTVEVHNPKGEKILAKAFTADAYGGFDGELELPSDATLGVYQIFVVNLGGGSFRVEEYKKPEFEVTVDAPTEPVMLGEKIKATINARYYFGAPVTNAKVKYKITRTTHSEGWYPPAPWDWLYGKGYWWFAYDYDWYPGWATWGCRRPLPPWWWGGVQPPELVAEQTVDVGSDGTVPVEIDTSIAKAIHPDHDHKYQVTAEVVDQSRRTIVGAGEVLVARKPFKVFAWVDRGYYRVDDTIHAHFHAHTLDQKPVKGVGTVDLLKISYQQGKPVETSVRQWVLNTDAQGQASLQIVASEAGQYRLSYKLTDEQKHTIEGAHIFTIIGQGFDGSDFRFNHLELIQDKQDYATGQTVNLQVNTDRRNSTVLLFVRPANGIYLRPKIMRLTGKSFVDEIPVVKKDMPNFFMEAMTISSGKVHTEVKEIIVPPESRVLEVAVKPSAASYRPGQKAKVQLKLTDFHGKPFVGSTVVAVYDKALEYISGGSNVQEIKEFFWKWRRSHSPNTETTLQRYFANLALPGQIWMQNLGIFGESVVEEVAESDLNGRFNRSDRMQLGAVRGVGGYGAAGGKRSMAESATADAALPAPPAGAAAASDQEKQASQTPGTLAPEQLVQPTVRTKFADTAFWAAAITTDEKGLAEIALDMPENLTTWKVKVWGMGHGTKVGQGEAEVITKKDLIVRLQAPRFFVEKDEVVLSANVHNYLKNKKSVQVALELEGDCLAPAAKEGGDPDSLTRLIEVEANGEQRVDWRVKVTREGQATVRMKALSDEESDATEQSFPVYVHGMLKMESFSGALRPQDLVGKIAFNVPAERRVNESRLEVRYSPTLAGAMVDALPYLVEYPYGCTEQTLNRFVPTVITQKILLDMGLDLKKIQEKRTNLNAQEIGDDADRAKQWKRFDRNPIFDQEEVKKIVKEGVQRLTEMQLSDGGWGWFSGWGEQSYPHTTAVVVHGLQMAQANDVALAPGVLDRGVAWLKTYQDQQVELLKNALVKPEPKKPYKTQADNLDALVYMVLADADVKDQEMLDFLFRDRTHLAVYAKALYGLALHKQNEKEKLDMILRNISQFVVEDNENQTAYLKLPGESYWWFWYGSDVEANAFYLKLLAKTDPQGELASKLVKYLLNNRKHATYWNSTRDTAYAIEALADYLKASGESKPDLTVEVWLDGQKMKDVKITAEDLFTFDNKFVLEGAKIETGKHTIELKKKGTGPLYYNAYLTNFTLEDFIHRAGLEVKVNRKVFKLKPADKTTKVAGSRGQAVDQSVEKYDREELDNLDTLQSSDLVEIELEIDSKNDYEYLIFEDMKAAGFEPVEVRSGYGGSSGTGGTGAGGGNAMGAYVEFRDNRVAFFVRALARGKHSVAYRMRAEIPGQFSALPAKAYAMYAPELKGNSDEIKLRIID